MKKRKPKQRRNAHGQFASKPKLRPQALPEPPFLGEFRARGEPADSAEPKPGGIVDDYPLSRTFWRRVCDFFRGRS